MSNDIYMANTDNLLIIIGPSAVGKSTLIVELEKAGIIELTPTWTDRPKRDKEVGQEHKFVSPEEMDHRAAQGYFVHEPLTFFGLPYRYALPKIRKPTPGKVPCVMARSTSIPLFYKYYPNFIIYQIEASKERASQYLHERQDEGVPLGDRLDDYEQEIQQGRKAAKRVFINNDTEATLKELASAIKSDFGTLTL